MSRKPSRSDETGAGRGQPATARSDTTRVPAPRRAGARPEHDAEGAERFESLAERVRAGIASFSSTRALARSAGSEDLASLFVTHAHMTPSAWLARERVRAARTLLEGREPIDAVASDVGFATETAFRRAFAVYARMTPEAYRGMRHGEAFLLRLPRRYRAADVLAYHGRDPASPSERVDGTRIAKAVTTPDGPAVLEIELLAGNASVRLHARKRASPRALHEAHTTALRLLGLTADVRGFEAFARADPVLAPLVARRRGLHLPLTATAFDGLCWAIIGQQINLAFAFALRRDVLELAGERIGGLIAHPTPERIASLDIAELRRRRFSGAKAEYLVDTAAAVANGELAPEALGDGSAVAAETALVRLRGIGTWTARYVLMRGVGFGDAAPVGDVALAAALERVTGAGRRPTGDEVDALMRRFSPYRSLATFHLWASLKDR